MSNKFSKDVAVEFDKALQKFDDKLVLSRNVDKYETSAKEMERSNDVMWRTQPYISRSYDGNDQTDNFKNLTELSVPSQVNIWKSVPFKLSPTDKRDPRVIAKKMDSAMQTLASQINLSLMDIAANQGTLVVKRTAAATGFDDVAQCEAIMNRVGVQDYERYLALSTGDYNGMAGNLAGRQNLVAQKTLKAYEKAYVGEVASFDTYKLDYANRLPAAAGTSVVVNGADQYHTPRATDSNNNNVDNRYQTIDLTVGGGTVAVGDAFTIAGVNEVHHITKRDTGNLKTFRIVSIGTTSGGSGTYTISPAIVSNGGNTQAEAEYQNVTATPANGAALTFLNTAAASVNPFWHKDAMEIITGDFVVDSSDSLATMRTTSENGLSIAMSRGTDIDTLVTKYRLDVRYGVNMTQPQMAGIMLFSQT